jgi:hypothetical protein
VRETGETVETEEPQEPVPDLEGVRVPV